MILFDVRGSIRHWLVSAKRRGSASGAADSGVVAFETAYRPVSRESKPLLDVWHEALHLGEKLPTLPLWLRGGICMPLDLEATYERTCEKMRVPGHGS